MGGGPYRGCLTSIFIFCLGVRSPWRMMAMTQRSSILWQEEGDGPSRLAGHVGGASTGSRGHVATHMLPEVVGTMGMSSASMGMDQGMWKWGASSLITMLLGTHRAVSH